MGGWFIEIYFVDLISDALSLINFNVQKCIDQMEVCKNVNMTRGDGVVITKDGRGLGKRRTLMEVYVVMAGGDKRVRMRRMLRYY